MSRQLLLCVGALLLAPWPALGAETTDESDVASDCFFQRQVRHYEIVDEQHIAVNVSHNRVYLVELHRPVRNLDRMRRLAFKSTTDRVCPPFSEVLVDGGVRIRSIREISEAERDALLSQGENIDEATVEGADVEDVQGQNPAQEEEEDQQ